MAALVIILALVLPLYVQSVFGFRVLQSPDDLSQSYDFVIVGAGTAVGLVVIAPNRAFIY